MYKEPVCDGKGSAEVALANSYFKEVVALVGWVGWNEKGC